MLFATVNKVTPRRICAQFLQKLPGKIVYATTGDTKRMQLAPNAEILGGSRRFSEVLGGSRRFSEILIPLRL